MEWKGHNLQDLKSPGLTLLAGLTLLIPALFWFFSPQEPPTLLYPLPGIVFWPAIFLTPFVSVAGPMAFFFVWNPGMFKGDARIPRRSYILLIIATALSIIWFVVGWKDGLAIQGAHYNYSIFTVNIICVAALWTVFGLARKAAPSFRTNLLLHWALFVWIAWYAFPFFGEFI